MCPKYQETQLALEIRAHENIPLGDALKKARNLDNKINEIHQSHKQRKEHHNKIPALMTIHTKQTYARKLSTCDRAKLLFTDTDSLCHQVFTDDLYKDMVKIGLLQHVRLSGRPSSAHQEERQGNWQIQR